MKKQIIGVDIDGVLANFNHGLITLLNGIVGRQVVAPDYEPQTWHYPAVVGYTDQQQRAAWQVIGLSGRFWSDLKPVPGAADFVKAIARGHDVYFVTARPGVSAKQQTEHWLRYQLGVATPTVLITSNKGLASRTLGFDFYVDDRFDNCVDVAATAARVYMPTCGWNRGHEHDGVRRVERLTQILDAEQLPYVGANVSAAAA